MHCDGNGGYILQDKIGLHVYIYMKCIGSYDISSLYLQSCNIISKTFDVSSSKVGRNQHENYICH